MLNQHQHSLTTGFTLKPLTAAISALTFSLVLATSSQAQEPETKAEKASNEPAEQVKLKTVKVEATAIESPSAKLGYLSKENDTGALGNKSVLDTPFSITVIGSDEILERGAKSIGQIFVNDASVYAPTPS